MCVCVFIGIMPSATNICTARTYLTYNASTFPVSIYGAWCVGLVVHLVNDLSLSSLDQVIPPLMCSLLDRVPEPKETQPGSIQPYSADPAEQSVPEPFVGVSCILMSSLVFTLCGTLLQLWHSWVNVTCV